MTRRELTFLVASLLLLAPAGKAAIVYQIAGIQDGRLSGKTFQEWEQSQQEQGPDGSFGFLLWGLNFLLDAWKLDELNFLGTDVKTANRPESDWFAPQAYGGYEFDFWGKNDFFDNLYWRSNFDPDWEPWQAGSSDAPETPEPSTAVLAAAGLIGIGLFALKRKT